MNILAHIIKNILYTLLVYISKNNIYYILYFINITKDRKYYYILYNI